MNDLTLLIDVGNTRLKWAVAHQGALAGPVQALSWPGEALPLSDWRSLSIAAVAMASVVPTDMTNAVVATIEEMPVFRVRRAMVSADWQGLHCAYAEPRRLGIDRWLALVAAYCRDPDRRYTIVSAGTALTVDRLDEGGRHRGGVIAPGLSAMRAGLVAAAPALMAYAGGHAGTALAGESADAIASGCLQAALGVIERHRRDDAGRPTTLLLTGGDAPVLAPHFGAAVQLEPALVLEGLAKWVWFADDSAATR